MSSIRTAIELQDNFTGILYQVIDSVNLGLSAMEDLHQTMNAPVDIASFVAARNSINQATMAVQKLDMAMKDIEAPAANSPVDGAGSVPVTLPVQWESDSMDVFTGTGMERFEQEIRSANDMLATLNQTQSSITETAARTELFPQSMVNDMNTIQDRMQAIRQRIWDIENNRINIGTDEANAGLEQLRGQLDQAVQEQERLNRAVENMDVQAANEAYLRLSGTIGGTERYIRDNTNEQGQFNRAIEQGANEADDLMGAIKGAVAAYATAQTATSVLNLSDGLTQTSARLNLMNDELQTTQDLVNMVYLSAQDARGSFSEMAAVVARFGNNAKDAFDSSAEVIAFSELVQKQMTIAGASTAEASAAMLQLSQGLGSGVLRGDELNSIFEQAPNLIQNIADYLGVGVGEIREMASEGELTADVVKNAIFAATDEINANFASMPMTWGQVWQSMQNTALIAFQPVLNRLNEIANSEAFQNLMDGAITALSTLAGIALDVVNLLIDGATWIADNWSWLSPIIYGIAAALLIYYGWMLLVKVATAAWSAVQTVLNAVMNMNPIMLIVLAIVALIAVIFSACSAIAKFTGAANTGFGIVCGAVNVVIQFFKNLGLSIANIALGIVGAIKALASNIMTAFHNAICSVQSWWYDLLSTCLSVIESICKALNKLPFVEFDYSGITSAADDYAAKAAEAAGNKEEYTSIAEAFNEGMSTHDTFQDGWASDAFDAGADWGDGIADKISSFLDGFGEDSIPDESAYNDYLGDGSGDGIGGIGDDVSDIAGSTSSIADSMDITEEDLKYLRDIAEQETINRFTTAEISIDMSGMQNTVNNNGDLDGFVSGLTDAVNEAVDMIAEGVHN